VDDIILTRDNIKEIVDKKKKLLDILLQKVCFDDDAKFKDEIEAKEIGRLLFFIFCYILPL